MKIILLLSILLLSSCFKKKHEDFIDYKPTNYVNIHTCITIDFQNPNKQEIVNSIFDDKYKVVFLENYNSNDPTTLDMDNKEKLWYNYARITSRDDFMEDCLIKLEEK